MWMQPCKMLNFGILMQLICTDSCLDILLYVETRSRFSGFFLMCLANSLSLPNLVQARPSRNRISLLHQTECADVLRPLYIIGFTFGSWLLFSNYSLVDIILEETTFRLSRHFHIWRYIWSGVKQTAIKNCTIIVQCLASSSCCKVSFEGCVFWD
jgi:hypothetical protein